MIHPLNPNNISNIKRSVRSTRIMNNSSTLIIIQEVFYKALVTVTCDQHRILTTFDSKKLGSMVMELSRDNNLILSNNTNL